MIGVFPSVLKTANAIPVFKIERLKIRLAITTMVFSNFPEKKYCSSSNLCYYLYIYIYIYLFI